MHCFLLMCARADFYAFGVGVYVLWAAISLLRTAVILSRRSLLALMRPLALAIAIGIKMAVVLTLWVRREGVRMEGELELILLWLREC